MTLSDLVNNYVAAVTGNSGGSGSSSGADPSFRELADELVPSDPNDLVVYDKNNTHPLLGHAPTGVAPPPGYEAGGGGRR